MTRWGAALLALGIVLAVGYYGLRAADVGKIGDPTDIGGGFILLWGYAPGITGVLVLLVDVRRRHRGQ